MKQIISNGDLVQAHLVGRKASGEEFVSTKDRPLSFVAGSEDIFPVVSEGVIGMNVGETRTFRLQPIDAYGEVDPRKVVRLERSELPAGIEVGAILGTEDESGMEFIVEKVESNYAIVNGNHPLAGETITVTITIVSLENKPQLGADIRQ